MQFVCLLISVFGSIKSADIQWEPGSLAEVCRVLKNSVAHRLLVDFPHPYNPALPALSLSSPPSLRTTVPPTLLATPIHFHQLRKKWPFTSLLMLSTHISALPALHKQSHPSKLIPRYIDIHISADTYWRRISMMLCVFHISMPFGQIERIIVIFPTSRKKMDNIC